MISVAAYLKGIPPNNRNLEKPLLLTSFIEGVNQCNDNGVVVSNDKIIPVDVALIQGFVHENSKNSAHLQLRKKVFDTQINNNKRCIIADSNLFLYADPGNSKTYLRYSYDGVFPNTGEYCNADPDPVRWAKIKKDLGIDLRPWNFSGKYILLCCQRDGGWSMGSLRIVPWVINTITRLRRFTDSPIKIRFHPGDRRNKEHLKSLQRMKIPNVIFSNETDIRNDFKKARAVVTYNSSPAVAAAIEGKPVIVLDPERSQAGPVSHHNLSDIEDLKEFDRELWIQQIAQMHWNLEELKTGEAWSHMKKWATIGVNQ